MVVGHPARHRTTATSAPMVPPPTTTARERLGRKKWAGAVKGIEVFMGLHRVAWNAPKCAPLTYICEIKNNCRLSKTIDKSSDDDGIQSTIHRDLGAVNVTGARRSQE